MLTSNLKIETIIFNFTPLELYLRSEMAKLRISAHSLRIESDRVKKLELSKRICLHCDLDEIEDETHFLLKCPLYQTE